MATKTETPKTTAAKRAPVDLVTRTKTALSQATLKNKITVDELTAIEAHCAKLKSLLS